MSAELVWAIVKNNNSFLVKRDNAQFSSEPGNLTNLNSFKYSGIANYKAKKEQLPAKSTNTVVIAKTRRQTAKSVANLIARANKYRPDLRAAALARASAIISSQQPKKTPKAREAKGVRAQKKN
ncbi:Putative Ribosomal protein L28e [Rhizopus microsporus]|nr:Putative Ribosomal protein L28e [Rhizopus microsporus]